jgi:ABC-type dipeptide/oligopeptide/nickel transport system permease component
MVTFVARRFLYLLATMLIASVLLFLLFELFPDDIAVSALGLTLLQSSGTSG